MFKFHRNLHNAIEKKEPNKGFSFAVALSTSFPVGQWKNQEEWMLHMWPGLLGYRGQEPTWIFALGFRSWHLIMMLNALCYSLIVVGKPSYIKLKNKAPPCGLMLLLK